MSATSRHHYGLDVPLRPARAAIIATCMCLAGGCSEAVAPESPVTGSYQAVVFTYVADGVTTDELAAGASVQISLAEDGSTAGTLFVPRGGAGGSDLAASLSGRWSRRDGRITFTNAANGFVGDMPFIEVGTALIGDETHGTTRIRLALTKTP